MTPIFPDCYDQWSLMFQTYTLFEGTEEECRQHAHDNFGEDGREALYLMDWEGREWSV
jgi:hypothetical protein